MPLGVRMHRHLMILILHGSCLALVRAGLVRRRLRRGGCAPTSNLQVASLERARPSRDRTSPVGSYRDPPLVSNTFSAPSFAALPKVSYALMMSLIANRWYTSLPGCTLPERTTFRSMGVVAVSTSRVVSVMLWLQSFSRCSSTGLP